MTKTLNLDKLEIKNTKSVILNGFEHFMKVFTVKDYVEHMKEATKIGKEAQANAETSSEEELLTFATKATIEILRRAFPTITLEEFENLKMPQLESFMSFIEDSNSDDLQDDNTVGETMGTASE